QSLGVVGRSADTLGLVADRLGPGRDLDPAADSPGQRGGGAEPRRGLQLGRAGPVPRPQGTASSAGSGGPGPARILPIPIVRVPDGSVPGFDPFGATLQCGVGAGALVLGCGPVLPGRGDGAAE